MNDEERELVDFLESDDNPFVYAKDGKKIRMLNYRIDENGEVWVWLTYGKVDGVEIGAEDWYRYLEQQKVPENQDDPIVKQAMEWRNKILSQRTLAEDVKKIDKKRKREERMIQDNLLALILAALRNEEIHGA
jgi:hypothetical protein